MTNLLIVEDDKDIAKALKLRLMSHGFQVAIAHDAATALIAARKVKPDIALLDISMPGGTGFDVAERLKTMYGHVPVVFLSANGRAEVRQRAKELGAVHFFEKPYIADDLVAVLSAAA